MEPECAVGVSPGMDSRKPLNAELNLVPFIDLLSCCISFLLITAVWTQLDAIAVQQVGGGDGSHIEDSPSPVQVVVEEDGYLVRDPERMYTIPKRGGFYDSEALTVKLQEWAHLQNPVELFGVDGIRYEDVIHAMDAAQGAGLHALWISSL